MRHFKINFLYLSAFEHNAKLSFIVTKQQSNEIFLIQAILCHFSYLCLSSEFTIISVQLATETVCMCMCAFEMDFPCKFCEKKINNFFFCSYFRMCAFLSTSVLALLLPLLLFMFPMREKNRLI